jgi:CHC2-type zinc finger protein
MKQWVNFRAVKNSVTMEQALARYSILLKAAGADIIRGRCPLPMHESKAAFSFSVDTRRNIWACHSESCVRSRGGRIGGNVLDFVASMEGCSIREAAVRLQDRHSIKSTVCSSDANFSGINRDAGKRTACFPAHRTDGATSVPSRAGRR